MSKTVSYERIVAAVDFSESSRTALEEAGRIAQRARSVLTVLHIADREASDLFEKRFKGNAGALEEALKDQLDHWRRESVPGQVESHVKLALGSASHDLYAEAELARADLVVLGARGHSNPSHRLGAIAGNCVRLAQIPTLLVRKRAAPPTSVVACIDYSEVSETVLKHAGAMARAEGVPLKVVHAAPPMAGFYADLAAASGMEPMTTFTVDAETEARIHRDQRRHLEEFVEKRREDFGDTEVSVEILDHVGAARAIIDLLQKTAAPLVVLGARGKSGFREFLLGTTAERILHEAPCSALVLREPAEQTEK